MLFSWTHERAFRCRGERRGYPCQAGSPSEYASVSTTTPHSRLPSVWRFTNRQTISSGATTSAGRQKKAWDRAGKNVVAMGIAWMQYEGCNCNSAYTCILTKSPSSSYPKKLKDEQVCYANNISFFLVHPDLSYGKSRGKMGVTSRRCNKVDHKRR